MVSRVSFQGLHCTILVSLFGVYNGDKMGSSSGGSGGVVAVCLGSGADGWG